MQESQNQVAKNIEIFFAFSNKKITRDLQSPAPRGAGDYSPRYRGNLL
jgi:hypothetical protein